MTISKYLFLTLIVIGSLTYSSKIPAQYESAAMGATIGAVAGAILTSCSPVGLLGGLTVGGLIGHRMESTAASND